MQTYKSSFESAPLAPSPSKSEVAKSSTNEIVIPSYEPTVSQLIQNITDELNRPRYAWERTYEGVRLTRRI